LIQRDFSIGVLQGEIAGRGAYMRRARSAGTTGAEHGGHNCKEQNNPIHGLETLFPLKPILESLQNVSHQSAREILREAAEGGGIFFEKTAEIL
jgi:hypothetical protein